MAKLSVLAGSTSQSTNVFVQDSSSTTGAGLTGLLFNTASLTAYYTFAGTNTTAVAISLATLAAVNSAWSSGGFKEIDGTNMPGVYRLDLPNAVLAASKGRSVMVYLKGAANMAPCVLEIELTGWDNQDSVRGGMTALPGTSCTANASLITSGVGTDQLSVTGGKVLLQASQGALTLASLAVSGTTTLTGNVSLAAGLTITQSTTDTDAVTFTGNGAGHGLHVVGGAGGHGLLADGGTVVGHGIYGRALGFGSGLRGDAAGTAPGARFGGSGTGQAGLICLGATNADGAKFVGAGSGHGIDAIGGAAVTTTAGGDGFHGLGGNASTSAGGVAGKGFNGIGGNGAASTNGAGDGGAFTGGGTTTVSGGNGLTLTHTGSGLDFNATTTPLVLAKTTNLTGLNDIAASAIVSGGAINTSGGIAQADLQTIKGQSVTCSAGVTVGAFVGNATHALTVDSNGAVAFNNATAPAGFITSASIASGALIAAVWDGSTSGHTGAGTFGGSLSSAASAGDPWQTNLPGSYIAGQAGFILGTFLNVAITSRLATAGYTAPPTAATIADTTLRRTMQHTQASSDGDAVSANSLYGFIQFAQKSSQAGGVWTAKNPDGSTLGTLPLVLDNTAQPITAVG